MENAKLLHAIITTALDGIITIDCGGTIEQVNPSVLQIFGYSKDELVGQNISILMPEPERNFHNGYLHDYDKTGAKKIIGKIREVNGTKKDGTTVPLRLAINEVEYQNRMIYTGFIHDLTREKEAEERLEKYTGELEELVEERTKSLRLMLTELQKAKEDLHVSLEKEKEVSRLKSRFVSTASHEFCTPLSSMQLSIVLIEKYLELSDREQIIKHLHKVKNAVASLNTVLNEFLSLEKLEVGVTKPTYQPFDILFFAEDLTEELQLITKTNQIIIYQHTGSESHILLDQNLLRHCLVNLISNAVKYSGPDTLIEFSTEINDDSYIFKVKDNGMGIPEEDQCQVFQPFFRAQNTAHIPGTGLGLSIVERYVHLMDGNISFESSPQHGTQFILSFKKTNDENQ